MTTAKQLRDLVIASAEEAIKEVPEGGNFRTRCFAAFLSAGLAGCDEDRMLAALHKLLAPEQPCACAGPAAEPDLAALEIAHRKLHTAAPLDDLLKDPTLGTIVKTVARRHIRHRDQVDVKRLQANDND